MKLLQILIAGLLILSASLVFAGRESGEKGGTADINIGVGELQETPAEPRGGPKDLKTPGDEEKAGLLLPAVQKVREAPAKSKNKGGNAETTWKVEKGEK